MKFKLCLLCLTVLSLVVTEGCATNAPPESTIAHYGGTVIGAVTELQKGITSATDSGALPVPVARELTTHVEAVRAAAGNLGTTLQAYHAATTLDLKKASAAEIEAQLTAINTAISALLKVQISGGPATQITSLIGNIIQAVSAVQAEVAKGLGQ